jgi:sulfur transfer protein SufE
MNHQELNKLTGKLMMSPTMQRLAEMASGMPLDPLNHDDLKTGLASCMFDVEDALDNNRIKFERDHDKAMFYGLLSVALIRVLGERPTAQAVTVH